ncbi:MAG: peptidoglycan DD-metalloendopeptidase family protein [Paraperlucidibaca sp.]
MLLLISASISSAWAADGSQLRSEASSAKSDLDSVKSEIRSATKKLRLTQAERSKQQKALNAAEAQINTLQKSVAETEKESSIRKARVSVLRKRQSELASVKREQLASLKSDMQASYRAGRDDYFKLLLNQQHPALLARQLRYFSYIQKARSERIDELDVTLAELAAVEKEEAEQLSRLAVLEAKLEREQVQLEDAKSQRAVALKILNSDIASQDKNLKSLKKNQAALQNLMSRLERQAREADRLERARRAKEAAANNKPAPSTKEKAVWSQEPDYSVPYRGNCSLPASGGIRAQFGADRGGGLRWNGIVIAANSGAAVKVVKNGKVLYADFLRGYGKLVIVDHGDGFMSLYGYNQSINVKTGDSVSANQTVASVGDGSEGETGLYFETRLRGRPSQPGNWCNY